MQALRWLEWDEKNSSYPTPPVAHSAARSLVDPTTSHRLKIVAVDNPACRYQSVLASAIRLALSQFMTPNKAGLYEMC